MIKKLLLATTIFLLADALFYFWLFHRENHVTTIQPCFIRYSTAKGNMVIHSLIDINFNEKRKTGIITIDGVVMVDGQHHSILHRKTRFLWSRSQSEIILTSKYHEKMNDDNSDDAFLLLHYPGFYSRDDYMESFIIRPQGNKGLIFYDGTIPLFYCYSY